MRHNAPAGVATRMYEFNLARKGDGLQGPVELFIGVDRPTDSQTQDTVA
jgi:hypothetical protein